MASPLSALTFPGDPDLDFALRPYDETNSWPSELPTGGRVGWKLFEATDDEWLEVSYPEVKWVCLRLTIGEVLLIGQLGSAEVGPRMGIVAVPGRASDELDCPRGLGT